MFNGLKGRCIFLMKIIKEHIKTGNFKPFYLLYGSESYLKKLYRDKLKDAIIGENNDMNYAYYEGKGVDPEQVTSVAMTLPFFTDRRLIVIENCGLFKSQSELSSKLSEMPDTTVVVFVETEIDKRNKLYKMVKDRGTVSEMNGLDEKNLKLFIFQQLRQAGKNISEQTISYFLDKTGEDMVNIINETEKLINYCMDRDVITTEEIDEVTTTQISGQIFKMIDAIASKQQNQALALYYDLLSLREKPLTILYLITRHFNILLQVKDMQALGFAKQAISSKAGIPPFTVSKYGNQSRNFSTKLLIDALEYSSDIEEKVKTGRLVDRIGVELLIISLSKKLK